MSTTPRSEASAGFVLGDSGNPEPFVAAARTGGKFDGRTRYAQHFGERADARVVRRAFEGTFANAQMQNSVDDGDSGF